MKRGSDMRYMIIERFKPGCIGEVYKRFDAKGRMLPDGLRNVDSWISNDLTTCWQLMETEEFDLFRQWTRNWDDLVDFEIVPTLSSTQARATALRLE